MVTGTQAPTASSMLAGSGSTAPNTGDSSYPGNNVGYGGVSGGLGGNGAIVIIAYPSAPAINSSLAVSVVQHQPVAYSISAAYIPLSFAASGLPTGLALNPATGAITGSIATPGSYSTTISATNNAGTTQATLVWTVTADTADPSTPANLVASNATTNAFVLTWSASTDNGQVAGYEVMRDSTSLGVVPLPGATLTGLTAGTTYQMKVRAVDTVGRTSAWSSTLSVTMPASGAAGAPYVNFADRTATTVALLWSPSGAAEGGYKIFRYRSSDGQLTEIGPVAETSHVDVGLSPNASYSYVIRALNAAGAFTGWAVSMAITTLAASSDADGDGIPNDIEGRFGTGSGTAGTQDTSHQLQTTTHRPIR